MASTFEDAFARFIAATSSIVAIHDLVTTWRVELPSEYVLDLYFNETLAKYSYTLVSGGRRVLGWDNVPHHPHLANFPHHLHQPGGSVAPSALNGDPGHALEQVRLEIEAFLSAGD